MTVREALVICSVAWIASPGITAAQTVEILEIGPQQSNLHDIDPDGSSGGRVNGLAVARTNAKLMYAASEWGGIFRSSDGGKNWIHVTGHVPVATWDVEIDPKEANRVYASSFYDGRVNSRAGINVSLDNGKTWSRPASAAPPADFCEDEIRREEPSAFGIAIDFESPANVFIGTNCGLAISRNRGATWTFVNPSADDGLGANDVWSVVVHHGGVIDTCGDAGHRRSTDGGVTWTGAAGIDQLPQGRCSLAVSPDEASVVFAVVGVTIHETDDGGASWKKAYTNPSEQGRIPFVAVNDRSGAAYDLWFGDISLFRASCTTSQVPAVGGAARCQTSGWAGPFTREAGGHDDVGQILFEPSATMDACPILFSSDGGVYLNIRTQSPACHSPSWVQPTTTPRALWNWDLTGVRTQGVDNEQLYFGNQDTGTFGAQNVGANAPTWSNQHCCDGFNVAADEDRVLSTVCCWSSGRATRMWLSAPGMSGQVTEVNTYPPGNLRSFEQLDNIVAFGRGKYVALTMSGVFVTMDIGGNPVVWRKLGDGSTPADACGVQVSTNPATSAITFFVKSGGCDGETGSAIWRHDGTAVGGMWKEVSPGGTGQFGVFAVDPTNSERVIAADLGGSAGPEMVATSNGGSTWTSMPALSALMNGSGQFRNPTRRGPLRWTQFGSYPQPTLVAFDPHDTNVVVAAGADSGVFLSRDGGTIWELLTDPNSPQDSGRMHIPRARYVHFDHDEPNALRLYIGTQGRGIWRIRLGSEPPVAAGPTSPPTAPPSPFVIDQPERAKPK